MDNIKNESISNLFKSTTNLDAFEDFLAGLPQFDADGNEDENGQMPEIGFDGMPTDLLAALREQVSRIQEQQKQAQSRLQQPDAPAGQGLTVGEAASMPEGFQPAKPEPKLVMPKRKVSVKLRKEEPIVIPAEDAMPEGEVATTLDSQDFAETMDNRDSANTRTY